MNFSYSILNWYNINKRDLPWRKSKNPYFVWLSEIILQQTKISQGLSYYLKIIDKYPNIKSLANAKENDILLMWQGLGYYSRARNLLKTAKYITNDLNGNFPNNYNDLLKLPGVGEYTASAISSICFNQRIAVVDGNVFRVLSRFYGIDTPINTYSGRKYFMNFAQNLMPKNFFGDYNQGIMDFGALICKPKSPLCNNCMLATKCFAKKTKSTISFPVKIKRNSKKHVHFNYIVYINSYFMTSINQIQNGIWKKLFQFPKIESDFELNKEDLLCTTEFKKLIDMSTCEIMLFNSKPLIHRLSHKIIHAKFWIILNQNINENEIKFSEINSYPVPKLIKNFLDEFNYKTFLKTFSYK
tara:strand:+ start:683 stop:1750 length:1068 start_codon:yes stop_codon:yes gene_type:complete